MTIYRIQFAAVVERCVEVPDDFSWSDAYRFVQESLGWNELAHSAAAVTTVDVSRLHEFEKQKPPGRYDDRFDVRSLKELSCRKQQLSKIPRCLNQEPRDVMKYTTW